MKRRLGLFALIFLAVTILGGSPVWIALGLWDDLTIDGRAAAVAAGEPEAGQGWRAYGGDAGGNRYSAANQVTRANVAQLEVAWHYRSGMPTAAEEAWWNYEATPILAGDRLVLCTPFAEVIALDPGSGRELWRYDPEVPRDLQPANQYTCRGVAHWQGAEGEEGACARRIFVGTADSRLIALDARSGRPCADFGEAGEVRIDPGRLHWPGEFQISSAPAIVGDTVVVGSSISDNQRVDAPRGTVRAYDAKSGVPRWQFDPLGSRDESGPGGHANVWSSISVDEGRGLVFLPTSSASPDFFGGERPGDNLYANSLVALDGKTGTVAWHFQAVHHDLWDYDLPAQPGLNRVWRDGKWNDVVSLLTKTGHVFVLDRDTGQPFLPIEERPVPQGGVEGETISPTQPFPAVTPALVPDGFELADSFGLTLWDRLACAWKAYGLRREGLYTPPSLEGTLQQPMSGGGGNWGSAAYDPARNLLVVNMSNAAHAIRLERRTGGEKGREGFFDGVEYARMEGTPYRVTREVLLSPLGLPCNPPPWGIVAGVDLATGSIVWRHKFGATEDLAPFGLAMPYGIPNFGGPAVTAGGLVFIGAAMDDYLRALDVETGRELWRARLPAGPQATPMIYDWRGRQFVVIVAGGHAKSGTRRGDHVIAYALPESR